MAKDKKKLKVSSLSGEKKVSSLSGEKKEIKTVDSEQSKADSTEAKIETKVEATTDTATIKTEAKPAQKVVSPLLSEPVEVKAYAMGIGPDPGNNTPPPSDISSMSVDGDFFATKPAVDYTLKKSDLSEVKNPDGTTSTPPPKLPPLGPDAPEQAFNPNQNADQNIVVPDNVSRQAAGELAETIMSMYERLAPELAHEYSKLNTKEIKKLEAAGDLMAGSHDDVVSQNRENKRELEKRAHDDATLIKKPLRKLLEVKNINAPPHIELLIILVFVALTYFMMVRGIKKSNDDLLNKLYEKINKDKFGTSANVVKDPDSDIPLAQTETVIK